MSDIRAWSGGAKTRLHPITPYIKAAHVLIPVVFLLVINLPLGQEPDMGFWFGLIASAASVIGGFFSWYFTGYRIDSGHDHTDESTDDAVEPTVASPGSGPELQIIEGVLTRKRRSIPISRLQSVEIAQPLLARMFGLAQLNLEVAGASSTEAPLAYLTLGEARHLRGELLDLSRQRRRTGTDPEEEPESVAPGDEESAGEEYVYPIAVPPIAQVPNRRVVGAAALKTVPFFAFLTLATALTSVISAVLSATVVAFVSLGITAAVVGFWGIVWFMDFNENWDFVLTEQDGDLRTRRGLLQKYSNTVPLNRVSALRFSLPVLWRLPGWRKVDVTTASLGMQANVAGGAPVLPVGLDDQARWVAAHALPAVDFQHVELSAIPRRVWWRNPLTFKIRGCGLNPTAFVVREGIFPQTTMFVPYARIQEVRITQGVLQRLQGVASVRARIAGSASFDAVAHHRNIAEAVEIANELRSRADLAVAHEAPRLG
ncbi:PH domain-containing protein [Haloglycomyces albus]|uniref:PH domain-containing protein n=1 Tax=Haloglycomyces albus TaxID=526067 RepID=UPI00046CAE95|nr:PH domain-containing protein [Haloglycomyces albus]